jgi:putative transcriptional regulator
MTNKLKEERVFQNLTQIQLAEMVQVSRQTIISIETARYVPSVTLSLKIARALYKKVEDLFVLENSD